MTANATTEATPPCGCEPHTPVWNKAGYDSIVGCRCLYLFSDAEHGVVKLGLVLHPSRIERRRLEVSGDAKRPRPNLTCVAQTRLHHISHQAAEHIEAVARHWLVNAHDFHHAGFVDWLIVPGLIPKDWQVLLDDAVAAATSFGRPPTAATVALNSASGGAPS